MNSATPYNQMGGGVSSVVGGAGPSTSQVLAQQDSVIRQQDQALDQLSNSIGTLKGMGRQIHGELIDQSSLLDDLEQGVDTTHASMKANNSKLNKLRKATKDNWLYCTILLLIVALIVVLYFVITD